MRHTGSAVRARCSIVHFEGHSFLDSEWQNAAIVFELHKDRLSDLMKALRKVAHDHGQDGIALVVGKTEIIKP
jgi:hypothetical protein